MPHLVNLNLPDLPVDFRLRQPQPSLLDPAVDERAVAPEYLAEHIVRAFRQRIEDYAHGFCRNDLLVCPGVALDKVIPAIVTPVALFATHLPVFHAVL